MTIMTVRGVLSYNRHTLINTFTSDTTISSTQFSGPSDVLRHEGHTHHILITVLIVELAVVGDKLTTCLVLRM